MKIRMIVGQLRPETAEENEAKTFLRPVAFPMTPTSDPGIVINEERDLIAWAESEFVEYTIIDVRIPRGALRPDESDSEDPNSLIKASTLDPEAIKVKNGFDRDAN